MYLPKCHGGVRLVEEIHGRLCLDLEAEGSPLLNHAFIKKVVGLVETDGDAKRSLRAPDAGDVIEVRVGEQYVAHLQPVCLYGFEQLVNLVAGVDHHRVAGFFAADDVSVLEEGVDSADLENHREPSLGSFSHYGMR